VLRALKWVSLVGAAVACTTEHAISYDATPSPAASFSPEAAPAPDASASGVPSVTAGSPLPAGAHVVGNACSAGRDSIACTPDGLEVLTCASGQWRLLQSCRGPGHCAGAGSALTCDTGMPQPGDSCVPATSEPRCRNAHEAIACQGDKWMLSPCGAGQACTSGTGKGHAGCK